MPSADSRPDSPASQRTRLLAIARDSIAHGLEQGEPLALDPEQEAPALRAPRASFVTLEQDGQLRGCIGHLEALTALACDVAENAYAAAFRDPRFPPLSAEEWDRTRISVSVLTPPQPLTFASEAELLDLIQPGIDGLILSEGSHRGTFLPSVWSQLPSPEAFLRHLKQKAGLAPAYWSDRIQVARYHTDSFSE
ncbi:AmmeMemoRadiSam system protein A [Halochromatium salexigens]|nr:AmmeMemoRadiSam system protein A [Halochromatium salexigens]